MMPANTVLLIRPASFGYNTETAESNSFQRNISLDDCNKSALTEFDAFAEALRKEGVNVIIADDTQSPAKPDAIFPNNWISFHEDGHIVLYPMQAENRRTERRNEIIETLRHSFSVTSVIDLTHYEKQGRYLEGTGSVVFDHKSRLAYASRSPRTDEVVLQDLCSKLGYTPFIFSASDRIGKPVYHTNVLMTIGDKFAIACMDAVSENDRDKLERSLSKELELITISLDQMEQFAGNMMQLQSLNGANILVMSRKAYSSLNRTQLLKLQAYTGLLPVDISTIETIGGGSARCMIAEIFLPAR